MFEVDPFDLELLDADLVGMAGDDYLAAHPELERGPGGRPLRGALLPLSAKEQDEWRRDVGTTPPAVAYQGPSADELRKRDPATLTDGERYWLASIDGLQAQAASILREAEARYERDAAVSDLRVSRAETDAERARREALEAQDGFFGDLGKTFGALKKALPWVAGGALVLVVGGAVVPVVVPLLAARRLSR